MVTQARVAVLPEVDGQLRIETVDLPDPIGHEVLVREFASGICHSQLHQMHGPRRSDLVLGHEATGEVLAVGEDVENVVAGDRVLLTFQPRDLRHAVFPAFRRSTSPVGELRSRRTFSHGPTTRSLTISTWSESRLIRRPMSPRSLVAPC